MRYWTAILIFYGLWSLFGVSTIAAQDASLSDAWEANIDNSELIPTAGWQSWDIQEVLPVQEVIWLRSIITNTHRDTVSKVLYLSSAQNVDITLAAKDGRHFQKNITGTIIPLHQRNKPKGKVLIGIGSSAQELLRIPPGESMLYLRYDPLIFEQVAADIKLYDESKWYDNSIQQNLNTYLIQGVIFGALLIISVYHLLIFIIRRDWPFLWYAVYTIAVGIGMMSETGVLQTLVFPEYSLIHRLIWETQIISMSSAILYFVFMRSFLDLGSFMPWLDRFVRLVLCVYIPVSLIFDFRYVLTYQHSAYNFIPPIAILLLGLFCVFMLVRSGNKLAMYFAMGSLILFACVFTNTILSILTTYQVIAEPQFPRVWFTEAGIILEILIFSLGLGYRLRLKDQEQEQSLTKLRTKISSDLHDNVGSMLTGLSMQSNVMSYTTEGPMKEKLKQISNISRSALETMRDTVWAIDGRQDNIESLVDKMRDFAEVNLPDEKFTYTVETFGLQGADAILPDVRQQTYLIYKEAMSNAIKYCNGDRIDIQLRRTKNRLALSIHDNGDLKLSNRKSGQGIRNMKMRAEQLGGVLEVDFTDGCRVELTINIGVK